MEEKITVDITNVGQGWRRSKGKLIMNLKKTY